MIENSQGAGNRKMAREGRKQMLKGIEGAREENLCALDAEGVLDSCQVFRTRGLRHARPGTVTVVTVRAEES